MAPGRVKDVKVGDLVYILNNLKGPVGVKTVWQTVYLPEVYVVLKIINYKVDLLCISNNTTTHRSLSQIKVYRSYPELKNLPIELQTLFMGNFEDMGLLVFLKKFFRYC